MTQDTRDQSVNVKAGDFTGTTTIGTGNKTKAKTEVSISKITSQGPELDQRLEELKVLIETLVNKLPPEKGAEIREDFKVLEEQAKSETPRAKWYDVSAKGLVEAASSVAGMAEPVTKAVQAVLKIITGS